MAFFDLPTEMRDQLVDVVVAFANLKATSLKEVEALFTSPWQRSPSWPRRAGGQTAATLRNLWAEAQAGEDVWQRYLELDSAMRSTDAESAEVLPLKQTLVEAAWKESELALSKAA